MSKFSRGRIGSILAVAILLILPMAATGFVLLELLIQVDLDPGVAHPVNFAIQDLENTGFTIRNAGASPISVTGTTKLDDDPIPLSEEVQDGFVLLDGTLLLEIQALDSQGGRAITRTTYQMDIQRASLRRDFIRRALLRQGVVRHQDPVEARAIARARARAMRLDDARIMRFVEGREGRSGRWVRAVRAIRDGGRADIRFTPRMEPDGMLGHFGTAVTAEQDSYVWAVMDRNSRYGAGMTVDREADGVTNDQDNCISIVNPNQSDTDGDGFGDACDVDDDDDGIADAADNCPLTANAGQEDFDADGVGDVCDMDLDADGVTDGDDLCLQTTSGQTVDLDGCSVADHCPCESDWKNHGAYVRCVSHTSRAFADAGWISSEQRAQIVSAASQSSCGH